MPSFQKLVILFTRYPQAGKCKSRLIPALGAEGALKIYNQLVSHILKQLHFIRSSTETSLTIFCTGGSQHQIQEWLNNSYNCKEQKGKDLGERMAGALTWGLETQRDTILIGSDCPDIDKTVLQTGFQALKNRDIVIGPAYDGGYYLIGVNANLDPKLCKKLFVNIPWGSDTVFSETLALTETLGLQTHIPDTTYYIDTEEDLHYFHHCSHTE